MEIEFKKGVEADKQKEALKHFRKMGFKVYPSKTKERTYTLSPSHHPMSNVDKVIRLSEYRTEVVLNNRVCVADLQYQYTRRDMHYTKAEARRFLNKLFIGDAISQGFDYADYLKALSILTGAQGKYEPYDGAIAVLDFDIEWKSA